MLIKLDGIDIKKIVFLQSNGNKNRVQLKITFLQISENKICILNERNA